MLISLVFLDNCSKFSDRIMNKYLIYTKDYRRENGVEYIPVYMTMFL